MAVKDGQCDLSVSFHKQEEGSNHYFRLRTM